MSGLRGDRTHQRIAIRTDDFRRYHEWVMRLREADIDVLGIEPGKPVPRSVWGLLDGPDGDPRTIDGDGPEETVLLRVSTYLDPRAHKRGGDYEHVWFGIDPGHTMGIAALCDGYVLATRIHHDVDAMLETLAAWSHAVPGAEPRIALGRGAPKVRDRIRRHAAQSIPWLPIVLVHEDYTSPKKPVTGNKHTDAACLIAMRAESEGL